MADDAEMIEDVRNVEGVSGGITLTQKEEEFIESCEDRLGDDKSLTPPMRRWLTDIWDRI